MERIRYWVNLARHRPDYVGPREAAVLTIGGDIVRLRDITDWSASDTLLTSIRPDEVEATFCKAQKGGWGGRATVVGLRDSHTIYAGPTGDHLGACIEKMHAKIQEHDAYMVTLQDPATRADALMATHDWFSCYSDSPGVSAAGDRDWEVIRKILVGLDPTVAQALLLKYASQGKATI